jgi:ABC-type antimicrobial peptide transport system permease subunit
VREAIRRLDPEIAVKEALPMDEVVAASLWRPRFAALLLGLFAALAVLLAMAGIYAVISYSVSQRLPEMGVRMSLGAAPAQIRFLVVSRALGLSALGAGAGLAAALAARSLVASQLYGVSPRDPLTLGVVGALLLVVSALAAYVPARRASRVDPARVLRAV